MEQQQYASPFPSSTLANVARGLIFVFLPALVSSSWPEYVKLESREFKTPLQPQLFRDTTPCAHSTKSAVSNDLTVELSAMAQSVGATPYGSFTLKSGMPRTIEFYDTPGDCRLKSNSWILRMRQEQQEEASSNQPWEGTFKSRNGDLYHSTYRRADMNECCATCDDLGGKFEEDLNLQWHSQFSYSHKCTILPNSTSTSHISSPPIHNLRDISNHWIEMEDVFADLQWTLDTSLEKVSNLTVTECVYNGFRIDFGRSDSSTEDHEKHQVGKFSVTLWYDSPSAMVPALAELSFKMESPKQDTRSKHRSLKQQKAWNKVTIMTAHAFWEKVNRYVVLG